LTDRYCRIEVGKTGRAAGSSGGLFASGNISFATWEGEGSRASSRVLQAVRTPDCTFAWLALFAAAGSLRLQVALPESLGVEAPVSKDTLNNKFGLLGSSLS